MYCIPERKRVQAPAAPIYNAPAGRHHHPLNLLNPLNPHAEGVSQGRHHHPLNPLNQPASGGPNPLNPEQLRCSQNQEEVKHSIWMKT